MTTKARKNFEDLAIALPVPRVEDRKGDHDERRAVPLDGLLVHPRDVVGIVLEGPASECAEDDVPDASRDQRGKLRLHAPWRRDLQQGAHARAGRSVWHALSGVSPYSHRERCGTVIKLYHVDCHLNFALIVSGTDAPATTHGWTRHSTCVGARSSRSA